jgi:glycosyltransferase involved in cell wall biosynthesis
MAKRIAVLLKGYPRLSETFIAQELKGLERAGLGLALWSMRRPTDGKVHPVHREIRAPVAYLPEYLHAEPWRVLRGWWRARKLRGYRAAWRQFHADLKIDFTRHRVRRFGQALVMAAELPGDIAHLHAHFIHTPASVARYASLLTGLAWTCSAHAKDIWTSSAAELASKLASARWVVTCTAVGAERLRSLAADPSRVHLSYHGLDLERFAAAALKPARRDGTGPESPVRLLTVCRAVEKKGLDIVLAALARLGPEVSWRWTHIGGGELLPTLKGEAERLGLAARLDWRGSQSQDAVLAAYRDSDIFVLACRIASDGDRDGLPNVVVEALSQRLCVLSTTVSGVPELVADGINGVLVAPEDADALAAGLGRLIADPALRRRLAKAGEKRVRRAFDHEASIADLIRLFAAVGMVPEHEGMP